MYVIKNNKLYRFLMEANLSSLSPTSPPQETKYYFTWTLRAVQAWEMDLLTQERLRPVSESLHQRISNAQGQGWDAQKDAAADKSKVTTTVEWHWSERGIWQVMHKVVGLGKHLQQYCTNFSTLIKHPNSILGAILKDCKICAQVCWLPASVRLS